MQLSNRSHIAKKINSVIITEAIVKRQKWCCIAITKNLYSLFCLLFVVTYSKNGLMWFFLIFCFQFYFSLHPLWVAWDFMRPRATENSVFILSLDATVWCVLQLTAQKTCVERFLHGYRIGLFNSLFYFMHLKRRFVLCVECLDLTVHQERAAWSLAYLNLVVLL